MEIDRILEQFINPDTGSLHGAVFIAVDKSGNDHPTDWQLFFRLRLIMNDRKGDLS